MVWTPSNAHYIPWENAQCYSTNFSLWPEFKSKAYATKMLCCNKSVLLPPHPCAYTLIFPWNKIHKSALTHTWGREPQLLAGCQMTHRLGFGRWAESSRTWRQGSHSWPETQSYLYSKGGKVVWFDPLITSQPIQSASYSEIFRRI